MVLLLQEVGETQVGETAAVRAIRAGALARMGRACQRMAHAMKGLGLTLCHLCDEGDAPWCEHDASSSTGLRPESAQCPREVPQRIWNRHSAYLVYQRSVQQELAGGAANSTRPQRVAESC